jgi:hypothetical protein
MMIRKIMVCALLFPAMLTAQKTLEFPTLMDRMKGVNKNFYIDKVIDARNALSETYLGRVQTGLLNAKTEAFSKNPLADELMTVIQQLLPYSEDTTGLILKVNRLKVWEHTFLSKEEAYAFCDFQLILKRGTTYYLVDYYNGFARKRSVVSDVTRLHTKNIVSVLKTALDTFQKRQNWLNPTTSFPILTEADLLKKSTLPILLDSVKKKGIYAHFGEFLTNKPSSPMVYKVQDGRKIVLTLDEKGQKKQLDSSSDAWGFCDGTDVFICQQGAFIPLELTQQGVFFTGFDFDKQSRRTQNSAMLFGLIGGAIAAADRGDLVPMMVNMDSGECQPKK